MNAPWQLPWDGDQRDDERKVKAIDRFPWVLKTGARKTEQVDVKRPSEPQFGMNPLFDPNTMKP